MAGSCNTTTPPNYLVNLRIIALHFARAGPKNSPICLLIKIYILIISQFADPNFQSRAFNNEWPSRPGNDDQPAYVITNDRLEEIRNQKMYPFFDQGGNDGNGDFQMNIRNTQPQINKQLNFLLPFYGFGFNYTWLSLHG